MDATAYDAALGEGAVDKHRYELAIEVRAPGGQKVARVHTPPVLLSPEQVHVLQHLAGPLTVAMCNHLGRSRNLETLVQLHVVHEPLPEDN